MSKQVRGILFFLLFPFLLLGQNLEVLTIHIISDNENTEGDLAAFEQQIREEIKILLSNRKEVVFKAEYCNCERERINQLITAAYEDSETDIVLALGAMTSAVIAQKENFPKPTIASIILDNELQNVPITPEGTSGKDNFTYIQSPFSFEKDLQILYEIFPYKNIGIIASPDLNNLFPNFDLLFNQAATDLNTRFTEIIAQPDATATLNAIPEDVEAVYVFPLFNELDDDGLQVLFDGLIERRLPSVALLGESMVEIGALVGYESGPNLAKMPRRIALDVSKIADGRNAANLPVLITTFSENVVINMNTVRKVGAYPNWDTASEAILLFDFVPDTDRTLSLSTVIQEALQKNLNLKVAEKDPLIAGQEVQLAKSELLPQLDANTSLALLDENTTATTFGTKGRLNWMVGSSLSQLVYAEPALANLTIQRLLQKSEESGLRTTQLDVVLDAVEAYLSVLQAKSFMQIQSANVSVTKNNLDIARAKDAVGYAGATDLNRWTTELALDKIDLNDAQAQFQQAKYALNQFLNHPIKEEFIAENIGVNDGNLMVNDEALLNRINNEKELEQLADFFVFEALNNLPEIEQLDYGLAAQERLLKSQNRAFYLPSVALSGEWDYTLKRWDVIQSPGVPIPENQPTWNLGLGVQYPILQGGKRRYDREKTQLSILQIKDQQADLRNQLELRVRAALQTAGASYFRVQQYDVATKAANENFKIVQDSYSQGLVSITNLIDAQNAKVQTELGAVNAGYQFILDFMEVERAIGFYYQLSSTAEQIAFFDRMTQFMTKKE